MRLRSSWNRQQQYRCCHSCHHSSASQAFKKPTPLMIDLVINRTTPDDFFKTRLSSWLCRRCLSSAFLQKNWCSEMRPETSSTSLFLWHRHSRTYKARQRVHCACEFSPWRRSCRLSVVRPFHESWRACCPDIVHGHSWDCVDDCQIQITVG